MGADRFAIDRFTLQLYSEASRQDTCVLPQQLGGDSSLPSGGVCYVKGTICEEQPMNRANLCLVSTIFACLLCLPSLAQDPPRPLVHELTVEQTALIANLPPGYSFDWVTVPEDWDAPEGPKLQVFYYWRGKETKPLHPLLFLNGGPGVSSHESIPPLKQTLGEDFSQFDFVFMDQRGTGCSSPLPEVSTENLPRFSNYLTRAIVRDAEAVRVKVLGVDSKWSVYGNSFGALAVQRYVAMAPRHLNSAYAHGWVVQTDNSRLPLQRLRMHDKVLQEYFERYPNDRTLLSQVWEQVDGCLTTGESEVCGSNTLDSVGLFLGVRAYWPGIHDNLGRLLDEKGQLNKDELKTTAERIGLHFFGGGQADVLNVIANRIECYAPEDRSLSRFYHRLFKRLKSEDSEGIDVNTWLLGEEARARVLPRDESPRVRFFPDHGYRSGHTRRRSRRPERESRAQVFSLLKCSRLFLPADRLSGTRHAVWGPGDVSCVHRQWSFGVLDGEADLAGHSRRAVGQSG